jgi:hypothetical protein
MALIIFNGSYGTRFSVLEKLCVNLIDDDAIVADEDEIMAGKVIVKKFASEI